MPLSTKPKPTTRSPTMSPRKQTNCISGFSYFFFFLEGISHMHCTAIYQYYQMTRILHTLVMNIYMASFHRHRKRALCFSLPLQNTQGAHSPQAGISSLQQFHPDNQVYPGGRLCLSCSAWEMNKKSWPFPSCLVALQKPSAIKWSVARACAISL